MYKIWHPFNFPRQAQNLIYIDVVRSFFFLARIVKRFFSISWKKTRWKQDKNILRICYKLVGELWESYLLKRKQPFTPVVHIAIFALHPPPSSCSRGYWMALTPNFIRKIFVVLWKLISELMSRTNRRVYPLNIF